VKTSVLSTVLVALAGCTPVQPKPECKAQPDSYAAHYFVQGTPTGMCDGKILTAGVLHLGYYRPNPSDANGTTSVGIEPDDVLSAVNDTMPATPKDRPPEASLGKYVSSEPDDNNICSAPTLTELALKTDKADLDYKWSNLKMIVQPLSNGVHFGADLVRRDGDCVATYKVSASYPVVNCGDGKVPVLDPATMMPMKDAMGNVITMDDPTMGKPSQALCEPVQGNGLSDQISFTCDESLICVPKNQFPSTR
jgi:hypothetical protein